MPKLLAIAMAGALASTACGSNQPSEVTVFAAASLTEAFTAIAKDAPLPHVTFDFDASSTLATQIQQGGPADVFASADETNMQKVSSEVTSPAVFARNRLEIVMPRGNPKHVTSLADLAKPGLNIALCAQQVPCGKFADQALANIHASVKSPSREQNVRAVLTKVELGEADAGIVYVTDAKSAAGKVDRLDIPDAQNVIATYPIAVVRNAPHHDAAVAFVRLVLSARGQRVLRSFGFLSPR